MASLIKNYFKKKKADVKFSTAGAGRVLGAETSSSKNPSSSSSTIFPKKKSSSSPKRQDREITEEAAAAALRRLQITGIPNEEEIHKKRAQAFIRNKALKELEDEKKALEEAKKTSELFSPSKPLILMDGPSFSPGIFYHCPLIGPEKYSKFEIKEKIKEFLMEQLEEEKGLTSALIIHTLNSNKEKVDMGVETLVKYLDNILKDPHEVKYQRIRVNNKIFVEKVSWMKGHDSFLSSVGFEREIIDSEEFWIIRHLELDRLETLRDALLLAEPIKALLHRDPKIIEPSSTKNANDFSIPPDFFTLTSNELLKEQQAKMTAVEQNSMVLTKDLRDRSQKTETRVYNFTLIRIRFPNGIIYQGTFSVYEAFQAISDYIRDSLIDPSLEFSLILGTVNLTDKKTHCLIKDIAALVPAALLHLIFHPSSSPSQKYLKSENN